MSEIKNNKIAPLYIEELSYFLGEELLSMDEKEVFLNTVMEANNREILKT